MTGGAGFIGSHVADQYVKAGYELAVIDDLSFGKKEQLPAGVKLYEGSIEDFEFVSKIMHEYKPQIINHHAAQVSVVVSTKEPHTDAKRNVVGTVNLLEAARQTDSVSKIVYASSGGAMYGNPSSYPCKEDAVAIPVSPYGLSKHTAERYVWLMAGLANFTATVLRYSNVYGPRQDPFGEAGVCAIFSNRLLKDQPVTIFGDGTQVRDYIYVKDVAAANLAALEKGEGQAYNIATGKGTTTKEVFEVIKEATGYRGDPIMGPARPGEVQAITLATEKAEQELGWKAKLSFKEGIRETINWYKEL